MIVTYIRSSSYTNYSYCQMQYFINYVLGWPSESNKKADLGTMAHKVMECLAILKKFKQENPTATTLVGTDDVLGDLSVSVVDFYEDSFLEELSNLSFEAYSSKFTSHEWKDADRKEILKISKIFTTKNDGQFDPRLRTILHPEQHFDLPIEESWAKFKHKENGKIVNYQLAIKGTIDLMTLVNESTIEVIDWKTGRRMDWSSGKEKDFKKLCNDPQLLLYFYAISRLFPQYPNKIMSIFFCKSPSGAYDPKPFSIHLEEEDNIRFLGMLKDRFKEILSNKNPKPFDPTRSDFKCRKLCTFYKNKWEGTNDTMCHHIEKNIKKHGIDETIKQCTRPGFDIGFYESPG